MSINLESQLKSALCERLEKLRDEIRELAEPLSEAGLWSKPVQPGNSIGHLILHLTGNLNYFVGGQLGGSGYIRDREREFTDTNPPAKPELLDNLDAAVRQFRKVVEGLEPALWSAPHPEARFGSILQALLHLLTHFAVHRGHMSYLARLVDSSKR